MTAWSWECTAVVAHPLSVFIPCTRGGSECVHDVTRELWITNIKTFSTIAQRID
jgi:hypothetical protein